MDPGIQVQPFERAHLDRVAAIERESFGADAWDAKLLFEYFQESPELFFIAKLRGRIRGYSISVESGDARSAELVSIAVDPIARQQGVGRALLDATRARLRSRKLKTWWLMAATGNQTALRFYERYGFRRTRVVKRYYGAGRDAWRMRLVL